ncbi:MAG: chalcone isomerase family protein [Burkholderiaceae bacterium]|nr:chalcone isomerase family protein [Burkholderiaceae bacterium]
MKFLQIRALGALACLLAGAATAQPLTVAHITYEDSHTVGGKVVHLNGAGVRYRALFQIYTAGLYLEKRAHTMADITAQPGAKRLSMTMLREMDSADLGKLFAHGIEDNLDRTAFSRIVPGVLRMGQLFSAHQKLQAGDVFTLDWIPGTGTVVTLKGLRQGEPFKEPEFFHALLSIWLGPQPVDRPLKEALLGKPPSAPTPP